LHTEDLAVLVSRVERRDLPCTLSPGRPMLGFDLRFHAGYEVAVPVSTFGSEGDELRVLFRVRPLRPEGPDRFFVQRVEVPALGDNRDGYLYFHGTFDVGEGQYQVDWLMRDRAGRVCADFWEVTAKLPEEYQEMALGLRPGQVERTEFELFRDEPPVLRYDDSRGNLHVKVLLNVAPQQEGRATLSPRDTSALVGVLRTLARDPRLGRFSLTVFNLQQRQILYRQVAAERIDFPHLGEALEKLQLGTVDLAALLDRDAEVTFLAELLRTELPDQGADAVIIVGPKAFLRADLPAEEVEYLRARVRCPVFYMNYVLQPYQVPWRDTIGEIVRRLRGQEFTISRPGDMWRAVVQMVSTISNYRASRQLAAAQAGGRQP